MKENSKNEFFNSLLFEIYLIWYRKPTKIKALAIFVVKTLPLNPQEPTFAVS